MAALPEIETRSTAGPIQASEDGMHFSGYAIRFGEDARIADGRGGFFYERVDPEVNIRAEGAVAFWNHNPDIVLGSTRAGTQRLIRDSEGIRNEIDLPDTSWGRDVSVLVRRDDVAGQSFAFKTNVDAWERRSDGASQRTLKDITVLEAGPTALPAYAGTTAMVRSVFGHADVVDSPQVEHRSSFTVAQHVAAANEAVLAAQEELGVNPEQAASLLVAGHNSVTSAAATAHRMDRDTASALGVDTDDIRTRLETAQNAIGAAATAAHSGADASSHVKAAADATAALMDVFNITGASMHPGGIHTADAGAGGDDIARVTAGDLGSRSIHRLRLDLIGVGIRTDATD